MPQEIRIQGDNIRVVEKEEEEVELFRTYRQTQGMIRRYRMMAGYTDDPQEFNRCMRHLLHWMRIKRHFLLSLTEEQRARITAEISTGNR